MRMLVKSAIAAATVAGAAALVIVAVPAQALPIPAPNPATDADIVCQAPIQTGPFQQGIAYHSWGSGYPANTTVTVREVVSFNGKVRTGTKSDVTTSSSGDWTTPVTKDKAATDPGLYEYTVTVTDTSGKTTYGTAYDACKQ